MERSYQQPTHPPPPPPSASAQVMLPSVAQLIASSSAPSTGSNPAYNHPNSSLPPIQCSTPHSPHAMNPSANPPSPPDQTHRRHTSRTSPTASASSASEQNNFHQSSAQSQTQPGVTFYAHQPEPEADPHRPTNARRQDSAISQPFRLDTAAKENSSFVRPSEPDLAHHSHRSPRNSHGSTSPTSPGHALSHPLAPASASTSTFHEHVTNLMPPAPELTNKTHSPLNSDPSHNVNARQPRFNVRFAANFTSENMPSAQRSRHSPSSTVTVPRPATPEPVATSQPEPVRPLVDPRVMRSLWGRPNDNSHPDSEVHEGPERCPGCGEAWKCMPVNAEALRGREPAKMVLDQARATEVYQEIKRQQEKENDEAFEQWKRKHSQCPVIPTTAPHIAPAAGNASKRKSEGSHGEPLKRRTINGYSAPAPPVQSSTPT